MRMRGECLKGEACFTAGNAKQTAHKDWQTPDIDIIDPDTPYEE